MAASAGCVLRRSAGFCHVWQRNRRASSGGGGNGFAPQARPASDFPDSSVSCSLGELGGLSLELVAAAEERRRREAMIETHHPEGWRRSPEGQVRYWLRSERYGVLGGLGFTAAGIQLGPRDDVFSGSGDARVANIGKVVCNYRFLLLPGVPVKGLAPRGPASGDGSDWCRLRGGVRGASGAGAEFRRAGAVRPELPRPGVEVLCETDVGVPFGSAPRGLAEAARGGLASGSVRRTGAGSRLVRIDLWFGGLDG